MKKYLFFIFIITNIVNIYSQSTKVAILDFENTSGKSEYDALSKAISNMIITDLANNIHPKKVEFFERSQLNKLLVEQKLQNSKNFDTKTVVDFGKLSGVNYVFVGSVFVMDRMCNFSSKLVDVQTSKIMLSKDVNGNIEDFLKLKTQLAEAIASQLNNPITLDPVYKNQNTTLATLNQYGKILTIMDSGEFEKAEQLREMLEETNPDFKYFKDLAGEISNLKLKVKEIKETLDDIVDPENIAMNLINDNKQIDKAIKYLDLFNASNNYADKFGDTKKLFVYHQKARAYYRLGEFSKSILYYDSALILDPNYIRAYDAKMGIMMGGFFAGTASNVKILEPDKDYSKEIEDCFFKITNYGKKNIKSFNSNIYRQTLWDNNICVNNPNNEDCNFFEYNITLPKEGAVDFYDNIIRDFDLTDLRNHIIYPTNLYARYLISKAQKDKAILVLENCLFQEFEFLKNTRNFLSSTSENVVKKDRSFNLLESVQNRNYSEIVNLFKPIFDEHAPWNFTGNFIRTPENDGFTDNIILLSNLLVTKKRYEDAINLLLGFKIIYGFYEQDGSYSVENFKILNNLLFLLRLVEMENTNIKSECKQIYEKEYGKILSLYGKKNLTFEQFIEELYLQFLDFHKNSNVKADLRVVLGNKIK